MFPSILRMSFNLSNVSLVRYVTRVLQKIVMHSQCTTSIEWSPAIQEGAVTVDLCALWDFLICSVYSICATCLHYFSMIVFILSAKYAQAVQKQFRFILESHVVECSMRSFYTHRFQKLIYLHLSTDCLIKILHETVCRHANKLTPRIYV